jgi:phage terminase large subunit-like protein
MPIIHTSRLPENAQFSAKRANRVINFVEKMCVHTKSKWAKKPFVLEDWQKGSAVKDDNGQWLLDGILAPLFGTVKYSEFWEQWVRQYSTAWIELGRKNGKSELIAALALYLLIYDGEWSAEIIGAASDKNQASAVFNVSRDIIRLGPLKKLEESGDIEIIDSRKRILYRPTMSTYQVVSADSMSNLGANPYAIIIDEVLAQPNRDLWDSLAQGFGTRPNQLIIGITTAGPDRESFAYTEHQHTIRAALDPGVDPSRFGFVAYVDEEADYEDESLWPEANPALGTFFDAQQLRDELRTAKEKGDYAALNNFRIFRLNQWGNDANRWLDMAIWDQSEELAGDFTDDDVRGVPATGGLDLASTQDLTSWVLVWQVPEERNEDGLVTKAGRTMIKPHFWVPRKTLSNRHRRMRERFLDWEAKGWLTIVDGDAHDYKMITDHIIGDIEKYDLRTIGYDQHQAPSIINRVEGETDVLCISVPQTTTRLNPGSQELTRLMGNRQLTANKNGMMRWNAQNAMYKQDSEGKIKPDKLKSKLPIDGIMALVTALTVYVGLDAPGEPQFFAFSNDDLFGSDDYDYD